MSWRRGPKVNQRQWRKRRLQILDRDGWVCAHCSKHGKMEVDHIKPLDDGGEMYDASNLQSLCASCHWEKSRSERRGREPDPEVAKWRKYLTNHYLLCMLGGLPTT